MEPQAQRGGQAHCCLRWLLAKVIVFSLLWFLVRWSQNLGQKRGGTSSSLPILWALQPEGICMEGESAKPGEGLQGEAWWCTTSLTTSVHWPQSWGYSGRAGTWLQDPASLLSHLFPERGGDRLHLLLQLAWVRLSAEYSRSSELSSVWPCSCKQVGSSAPSKGPHVSALGFLAPALSGHEPTRHQQRSRGL